MTRGEKILGDNTVGSGMLRGIFQVQNGSDKGAVMIDFPKHDKECLGCLKMRGTKYPGAVDCAGSTSMWTYASKGVNFEKLFAGKSVKEVLIEMDTPCSK